MEMYLLFKAMFEPYLHKARKRQLYEELTRDKLSVNSQGRDKGL
jgi:hypothetical protein